MMGKMGIRRRYAVEAAIERLEPRALLAAGARVQGSALSTGDTPIVVPVGDRVAVGYEDGIWIGDRTGSTLTHTKAPKSDLIVAHGGAVFSFSDTRPIAIDPVTGGITVKSGIPAGLEIDAMGTAGNTLWVTADTAYYDTDGWHLYIYNDKAGAFQDVR